MTKSENAYHNPALYQESIDALNIQPGGIYVDATFGGGGHSKGILQNIDKKSRLIAFDRDLDAQANVPTDKNFLLVHNDFIHLKNFLRHENALPVNGILADLGISSHQIDVPERGFSFRFDAPLDMRMDKQNPRTAAHILNEEKEDKLVQIFSEYGEVQNSKTLARAIATRRRLEPIETTSQLAALAQSLIPARENLKKYLAPVFQALRIEVNDELNGLKSFLEQSLDVLAPGGRLAIITYHSLEDRIVKNFMQLGRFDEAMSAKDIFGKSTNPWKNITRKPIIPSEQEIEGNPRVRSAKLRVAEKI
ncbi:MAG: 16S rRNA (cytosine(1402)-N(4))-methyltransferase RsmH [Sphingobacteriales bacterium]|nr:MAG: 16S rRNA (cytosine(1402)-N(4))-methyltransferase RsmH [Sphingobacteriales bacterium]